MEFSLDKRTATLSVGEFSDFVVGPRDSLGGPQGIWRAQLGTHWHQQLRQRTTTERTDALFEVPIGGQLFHRGWTLTLNGRIDQVLPGEKATVLREIKTVTRELPAAEEELHADYPSYFAQIATYLALRRLAEPTARFQGELVFVEADSGLAQTIALGGYETRAFDVQLERVVEFLNLRLAARERLQKLSFRPAFAALRPGQETIQADLTAASARHSIVFFEAPTGFGKTGAMLEFALTQLRESRFERVLYLTSKSTGQLQVVRQLQAMTVKDAGAGQSLAIWHVRNKSEHCVNHTFHCVREVCSFIGDTETRWQRAGLARFYLFENEPRDLPSLREAGRAAQVCPYEITRTALAFNDVWIGDYNYVFAPNNRGLFYMQPGFDPARTLLIVDEAHNLSSRVADAYSHTFSAADAFAVSEALHQARPLARLVTMWDQWTHFLQHCGATDSLSLADEEDARDLLTTLAQLISTTPFDPTVMGPERSALLWQIPTVAAELAEYDLPRLWWSPRAAELTLTCLDAAKAIGPTLRAYAGVILASATLGPPEFLSRACGLDTVAPIKLERPTVLSGKLGSLSKRETARLNVHLTGGTDLLRVEEEREAAAPTLLQASTPWREKAYDIAYDLRVDTTFQQRAQHYPTTAATVEALHAAAGRGLPTGPGTLATPAIVVFFPSYRYAEAIRQALGTSHSTLRVALQPRLPDLAAQNAWVEESLLLSDALFLVLGSSFAEGIDLLGGRVTHAMVVGPALPEVNAVQRARLEAIRDQSREIAFSRVYQIPGIQKVNQALGRLVRAPGHNAKVLLHCRRFIEPAYAKLLAREYQFGTSILDDLDLETWLNKN